MKLILYTNLSGSGTINKVLENPLEIDINVRNDFDIINPQFMLSKIDGVNFSDYDYCEIQELNRFYFIDSKTAINSEITSFQCSTDVLETYKSEILASNARFYRGIKTGDYVDGTLDRSAKANVILHESNKSLVGEATLVLTTVGGYEND